MTSILIVGLIVVALVLWVGFGVISGKVALGLIALVLVPVIFWFWQSFVNEWKIQTKDFHNDLSIKERIRKAQEDACRNSRSQPLSFREALKKAWDKEKRRSQK